MSAGRPKPPGRPGHTVQQRMQACEVISAYNATRHLLPKCGAKRRTDGEPCQQIAMANGRCAYHGGKTPRGDRWHRLQPASTPEKTERKLRDRDRAAKRRAKRLAAMAPEEWAKHTAWHSAHQPGPPHRREARRNEIAQSRDAFARLNAAQPAPEQSAEAAALSDRIEELKREAERLGASLDDDADQGVFG